MSASALLINPVLLELAEQRLYKQAFAPPPGAGGPPPGDPSMGGGAPPMDPSMMGGGAPPMDPSMMGGMPPGAPPMDPSMMGAAAPPPAMPAPMPAAAPPTGMDKPAKPDINTVAMDTYQTKRLIIGMYNRMGWELPEDLLLGPNRDPSTGVAMPPNAPGSTSDPNRPAAAPAPPDNALQPPAPVQPAMLGPPPPGKMAAADDAVLRMGAPFQSQVMALARISDKASAISAIRRLAGQR